MCVYIHKLHQKIEQGSQHLVASIVAGFALVVLTLLLLHLQPEKALAMARPAADARQAVAAAWQRAQDSGAYHFTADVHQTRTPLPTPLNAGRQSQEQSVHLEGQADLTAEKLEFSLWSDAGQVLGRKDSRPAPRPGQQPDLRTVHLPTGWAQLRPLP